jgi:tRNA(Ile)-lysidine synthase
MQGEGIHAGDEPRRRNAGDEPRRRNAGDEPRRRNAAPSLATRARRVLDSAAVPHGATIVVACSGGPDSQALLDVLAHVARSSRNSPNGPRVTLVACGVDHGLRPEAAAELDLVRALADARGVPFRKVVLAVAPGPNLQARARAARYEALRAVAAEVSARHVATAHHLEDRAETVLIRLLRGAPVEGLAVMPPASHDLLRPLIHARRAEILAHVERRSLAVASDPSNHDPRYLRTRVRTEVLPLLRSMAPRIDHHLADLADAVALRADVERDAALVPIDHTSASSRALRALRDFAARGRSGPVLLRGGRVAQWDQDGRLVITGEMDPIAPRHDD